MRKGYYSLIFMRRLSDKAVTGTVAYHKIPLWLLAFRCYGNRSVIGNRGRRFTFRNWGVIGLSPASGETTQTNKPPKHYTKTGRHETGAIPRPPSNKRRQWRTRAEHCRAGENRRCHYWRTREHFTSVYSQEY